MAHTNTRISGITSFRRRMSALCLAVSAMVLQPLSVPLLHAQQFGDWQLAASVDPSGARGINTSSNDGCPIESPDGDLLFFASNRAGTHGMNDVWVASRLDDGTWGDPVNLTAINSEFNDFCPTPLPGNRLLFVSSRSTECGGAHSGDIFYTRLHPVFGWLPPEHLGCEVNSPGEEFSPSVFEAGGETWLYFSSGRIAGGKQHIYASMLQADGHWGTPIPVSELNSDGEDARPNVRKDGLEIVFDTTREGGAPEIYSATRSSVSEPWSAIRNLGSNVNSTAAETRATLSRDGRRLYFGSMRPGRGSTDIYVSERSGPGKKDKD